MNTIVTVAYRGPISEEKDAELCGMAKRLSRVQIDAGADPEKRTVSFSFSNSIKARAFRRWVLAEGFEVQS